MKKFKYTNTTSKNNKFNIFISITALITVIFASLFVFEKNQDKSLYSKKTNFFYLDKKILDLDLYLPWKETTQNTVAITEKSSHEQRLKGILEISDRYNNSFLIIPKDNTKSNFWIRFFLTDDFKNALDINTLIIRPGEEINIKNIKSSEFNTLVFQNLAVFPHKRDKSSLLKIATKNSENTFNISPHGELAEVHLVETTADENLKISWDANGSGILLFYGFKQKQQHSGNMAFLNANFSSPKESLQALNFYSENFSKQNSITYQNIWPLFFDYFANTFALLKNDYPANCSDEKSVKLPMANEEKNNLGKKLFEQKIATHLIRIADEPLPPSQEGIQEGLPYIPFLSYLDRILYINQTDQFRTKNTNNFTYILYDTKKDDKNTYFFTRLLNNIVNIFNFDNKQSFTAYSLPLLQNFDHILTLLSSYPGSYTNDQLLHMPHPAQLLIASEKVTEHKKTADRILSQIDIIPTIYSLLDINSAAAQGSSLLQESDKNHFIVVRNNEDDVFIFQDNSIFSSNFIRSPLEKRQEYVNEILDFEFKYKIKPLSILITNPEKPISSGEVRLVSSLPTLKCYSDLPLASSSMTKSSGHFVTQIKVKQKTNKPQKSWSMNCVFYGDILNSSLQMLLKVNESTVPPAEISLGAYSIKPYQEMASSELLLQGKELFYLANKKPVNMVAEKYALWFSPFLREEHKLQYSVDFNSNLNLNEGALKNSYSGYQ